MKLPPFKLERYFAQYEFTARYLLCCSDCQSFSLRELLALEPGAEEELGCLWLGYTEPRGDPRLRAAIGELYTGISPEDILVHAGAEEAIYNFMNAFLTHNDHVIVLFPCYQSLLAVAEGVGCRVDKWRLRTERNRWVLDMDDLASLIRSDTKAIIINTPHNPTGYLFSQAELEKVVNLARECGAVVLSDEVYRYLEYDPADRPEAVADIYESGVSVGALSKAFGLPGLRIAWVATRNNTVLSAMQAYKDYTTICCSAPSEFLATVALRRRTAILDRNIGIIRDNLHHLELFFAGHRQDFTWFPPQAGPIAFPLVHRTDADAFCRELVAATGVLLLPPGCYDWDRTHIRVGFGRVDMPVSLDKLAEYIG